ncbi:MAG: SPOR domain-containing protein [Acidobacteria bacterium]|nr:SPOR domain-containing protein [Acidobacteriota bacterium]
MSLDQSRTATTDQAGRFRFLEVPEGPHKVTLAYRELPADYDPGTTIEATVLVKPKRISRADLDVVRLTLIEGKITAPAGVSAENILIKLLPTARYTTTDSEGNFSFQNLREGDYELALDQQTLPENAVLMGPPRVPLSARPGAEMVSVRFQLGARKQEKPVRKIFEEQPDREPVVVPAPPPPGITAIPQPRPPVAPVSVPGEASRLRLYLQVGAFKHRDAAAVWVKELKAKGYTASTLQSSDFLRVVVGPFSNDNEAARLREKLHEQGYETLVRRRAG